MSMMGLLRRALMRGLKDGGVQKVRVEVFDDQTRDGVERWQDYGFAGNPGDGQGLVIEAGGHTVVLRMDRAGERPQLDAYEVAVWHKDGHHVILKAGRQVEVVADQVTVKANMRVEGDIDCTGTVNGAVDVTFAGISGKAHGHGGVESGPDISGPPVAIAT